MLAMFKKGNQGIRGSENPRESGIPNKFLKYQTAQSSGVANLIIDGSHITGFLDSPIPFLIKDSLSIYVEQYSRKIPFSNKRLVKFNFV